MCRLLYSSAILCSVPIHAGFSLSLAVCFFLPVCASFIHFSCEFSFSTSPQHWSIYIEWNKIIKRNEEKKNLFWSTYTIVCIYHALFNIIFFSLYFLSTFLFSTYFTVQFSSFIWLKRTRGARYTEISRLFLRYWEISIRVRIFFVFYFEKVSGLKLLLIFFFFLGTYWLWK